ncbi:MAG: hypothetical protein HQ523_08450 [Lentisphaerae bacterium]|nr:hypothetical protein [Lentisphaerota bacterium]
MKKTVTREPTPRHDKLAQSEPSVTLNPKALSDEAWLVFHELYHIVRYGESPENTEMPGNPARTHAFCELLREGRAVTPLLDALADCTTAETRIDALLEQIPPLT